MPRKDSLIKPVLQALKDRGAIEDFVYDHFRTPDAVPLPYAIYRRVAQPNFSADGVVYSKGGGVDVEFYAATPDEMADLMDLVEELLDAEEIFYNMTADTVYIESDDYYVTLYEI